MSRKARVYRVLPEESASRFRLENPDEFFARYPAVFRSNPMRAMRHQLPNPVRMTNPGGTATDFGWLMPGGLVWSRLDESDLHGRVEDDILRAECETLQLDVADSNAGVHLALNPPVCDALDIDRSGVTRDDSGRIVGIERYVFVEHRLIHSMFRLPHGSAWEIFAVYEVEEPKDLPFADLYSACRKLDLRGLKFEPVWEGLLTR